MDITSSGRQAGYCHKQTNSDPATHQQLTHSLPTEGLKAQRAQTNKRHSARLAQRSTTFARQADKLPGHCLANTDAVKAMP